MLILLPLVPCLILSKLCTLCTNLTFIAGSPGGWIDSIQSLTHCNAAMRRSLTFSFK